MDRAIWLDPARIVQCTLIRGSCEFLKPCLAGAPRKSEDSAVRHERVMKNQPDISGVGDKESTYGENRNEPTGSCDTAMPELRSAWGENSREQTIIGRESG